MSKFLIDILPIIATIPITLSYFPQLLTMHRGKTAKGVSTKYWAFLSVGLIGLWINAFAVFKEFGTYGYLVKESFDVVMCVTTLIVVLFYKSKEKKQLEK